MIYPLNFVMAANGHIIPLQNIESINFKRDLEDSVVDALKGDHVLEVTTCSGRDLTVSMIDQLTILVGYELPEDVNVLAQMIFNKWVDKFLKSDRN